MRTGSRSRGGTATAVPPRLLFVPRTPCRSGVTQAERDAGTHTDGWTSDEREELARLRRDNRRLSEEIEELLETQAHARVLGVLKNPSYARAYVHGRYPPPGRARRDGTVHTGLIETAPRLVARVNPKTTMRVTSPGRSYLPLRRGIHSGRCSGRTMRGRPLTRCMVFDCPVWTVELARSVAAGRQVSSSGTPGRG